MSSAPPPQPLRLSMLVLTAAAAAMGALLAYLPAAGHDQLWCLYVARHALHGTPLYGPELMESNPPLILWLSMLPAGAAELLHIPAAALGKLLVLLLQCAIAALSLRQLRRRFIPTPTHKAALLFAFVTLFNVVPARDLGQRDYLLALFAIPYLLRAASLLVPPLTQDDATFPEAVLIGLLAAIGFALKPHQTLVPLTLELFLIARTRSLRPLRRTEPLILFALFAIYLFAIRHFTPAYLTTILPILRETYWAVGSLTLPHLVLEALQLHLLAALTLIVCLRNRAKGRRNAFSDVFLVAGAASTAAYYLQGTGWYYQQLPAITFFTFALVFELLPSLETLRIPRWLPHAATALSLLAVALTTHFMNYPFTADRSFAIDTPDPAFFRNLPPGTPVATLTTTVDYTVMPAARWRLTIAQRYPHLWMLPAILRNEDPASGTPPRHQLSPQRLAQLEAFQHHAMVEDLQRWRPSLVLVERCQSAPDPCQLLEDRRDNLLAWFLRDPEFTSIWHNYSFAGSHGRFDAYELAHSTSPQDSHP